MAAKKRAADRFIVVVDRKPPTFVRDMRIILSPSSDMSAAVRDESANDTQHADLYAPSCYKFGNEVPEVAPYHPGGRHTSGISSKN